MAKRNTPTPWMRGIWKLIQPWSVDPTLLYTCVALRKFKEIIAADGIDIYNIYYKPKGISQDKYREDLAADAVMVVLTSDVGSMIHVPDTYIESYPGIAMSDYGIAIISAQIGPISLNTNFDFMLDSVANVISDTIGIKPAMNLDHIPTTTALTPENAAALEAARQAAIKNRTSTYAQLLQAQRDNASLRQTIKVLQDLLASKP